jgi:hypothetical protein
VHVECASFRAHLINLPFREPAQLAHSIPSTTQLLADVLARADIIWIFMESVNNSCSKLSIAQTGSISIQIPDAKLATHLVKHVNRPHSALLVQLLDIQLIPREYVTLYVETE